MSTAIVWFRQDLRCHDNPALADACANHEAVLPLYIYQEDSLGAAQNWWLHHSLLTLSDELQKHNMNLCLKRGHALSILQELIKTHQVDTIYWNRCYEPFAIQRDMAIKEQLKQQGLTVISSNSNLLNEPWTIKNKQGGFFKVFTPYWKHSKHQVLVPQIPPLKAPSRVVQSISESLHDWSLLPQHPDWAKEFSLYWQPGEKGAQKKLHQFIEYALQDYKENRNQPSKRATSYLSPHLHFGEISPWEIWHLLELTQLQPDYAINSVNSYQSELGWREFSYYLLYHFPGLPEQNFRQEFNQFPWQEQKHYLRAWQTGTTGFPIVDAGMRELWRTGYMHNRVRMIVASFLTKDLFIDWRIGAQWFYSTLLDADVANNSASWQWVAGTGVDSAPYFRIFNPSKQGEQFDPQGEYVKTWVPELSSVPTPWIHKPWEAPKGTLKITLGTEYPYPIVDHAVARKEALQYYQEIKKPGRIE